jgi:hypothetical protein
MYSQLDKLWSEIYKIMLKIQCNYSNIPTATIRTPIDCKGFFADVILESLGPCIGPRRNGKTIDGIPCRFNIKFYNVYNSPTNLSNLKFAADTGFM